MKNISFSKFLTLSTLLFTLLLSAACTPKQPTTSSVSASADTTAKPALVELFQLELEKTQALIAQKTSSGEEILSASQSLLSAGKVLLQEIATKQKECAPILNIVLENAEKMTTLSLEEIEEQFHQGKALPDGSELCYESKEFVVHPATVLVLARTKGFDSETRGAMAGELGELAHHIDTVEILLNMPENQ